ncbi:MAG: class I SAM-dependent methyltransferase [Candidatus Omnitrophica bacterium]|nr:class I SAM-dependent methyltransferase [Candidatus Omnitrophota bacterium]
MDAQTNLSSSQAVIKHYLQYEPDVAYCERVTQIMEDLNFQKNEKVLDCGCGLGTMMALVKKIDPSLSLIGLDFDSMRLKTAKDVAGAGNRFVQGSVLKLPFLDASFDKIICSELLEHLEDDFLALQELFRVLKPGGVLSISVPYKDYPFCWDPLNKIREFFGLTPWRKGVFSGAWTNHERLYARGSIEKKCYQAGFRVEKVSLSSASCFPFAHFFIYRIGRGLSGDQGKLARKIRFGEGKISLWNPIFLGTKIFQWFGKASEPSNSNRRFINLVVKATKKA